MNLYKEWLNLVGRKHRVGLFLFVNSHISMWDVWMLNIKRMDRLCQLLQYFLLAPDYPPTLCFVMLSRNYANSIYALANCSLLTREDDTTFGGKRKEPLSLHLFPISFLLLVPVNFTTTAFPLLSTYSFVQKWQINPLSGFSLIMPEPAFPKRYYLSGLYTPLQMSGLPHLQISYLILLLPQCQYLWENWSPT